MRGYLRRQLWSRRVLKQVSTADAITCAHFASPHPDLRRYVTTYYIADVTSPDGSEIEDLLHPEWGSVRYLCKGAVRGSVIPAPLAPMPPVVLAGPTTKAAPIACVSMRIASFGLLPLGWHRFVGLPASAFADAGIDAALCKAKTDFASWFNDVKTAKDLTETAAFFDRMLLSRLEATEPADADEETRIEQVHRALIDPDISSVSELTDQLDISVVQLERLSKRVFGFPPKLLLRRQRFLRTLAKVLREPRSKWGEILDPQYYDQAHFNRDFRRFFGLSPRQYLALPRPIVAAAAQQRLLALGGSLQGLQQPQTVAVSVGVLFYRHP
jgi:AraC-like DNA-binding protein